MNTKSNTQLFAFKLASKAQSDKKTTKWTARDGVSVAGCTRSNYGPDGLQHSRGSRRDAGNFC